MLSRYKYKKIQWIDLESPSQDEAKSVMKEFDIHPLVANELLSPTLRPKVDKYPEFLYVILHFPAFQHTHGDGPVQEVDFIIGKDFLITAHYDTIDPLHEFTHMFEVDSVIKKSDFKHAGMLFYSLARELYRSLSDELVHIEAALNKIEEDIFRGKEKEMVESLSLTNRDLLDFKQAIRLHNEVLASLEAAGTDFFDKTFSYYLRALAGEYHKIASQLEGHRETLIELRKTNDSLLSAKQNEIMRTLTIMAFATFPLSLIAGIFGMNTKILPVVGLPGDFWIIIGIMVAGMALMFWYFKHNRWI